MFPNTLPEAAPGEKWVFKILRDAFPDEFLVWHEPATSKGKPDFIMFSPNYGLLVVEVKGWDAGMIIELDQYNFKIQRSGVPVPIDEKSPLKQAEDYKYALMDMLKEREILLHATGPNKGKLAFPVGRAVFWTQISRNELISNQIDEALKESLFFQEDLLRWQDYGQENQDRDSIREFKELFDSRARFQFQPLTEDQTSTIKGVIHPFSIIREEPAKPTSWNQDAPIPQGSKIFRTLDHKQEQMAQELGTGHRIISGVAGSGKTFILIARARWLAEQSPEDKILILCYNITLAAFLRSTLITHSEAGSNINVMNYHEWAREITDRSTPNYRNRPEEEVDEEIANMVSDALNEYSEKRWHSILIDEAHLLHPSWFKNIRNALIDGDDGNLLIVSDVSQKLKRRQRFTWREMGIRAVGRSRIFRTNYRNTKQILGSAWSLLQARLPEEEEADETFPTVTPNDALRTGPKVRVILSDDEQHMQGLVMNWLNSIINTGTPEGQIALLYRRNPRRTSPVDSMTRYLESNDLKCYWVSRNYSNKRGYSIREPGIRVITTQSALGLEFKAVGILWVDQYDDILKIGHDNQISALKEFYVGMTRSQEHLALFCKKGGVLTNYLNPAIR